MIKDHFGLLKKQQFIIHDVAKWILEHCFSDAKVTVSIPMWAIH